MHGKIFLFLFALTAKTLFAQTKADDILGEWLSESGKAKIEVFKSADKYYGKIIWLKNPLNVQGQPKTDIMNPDPEKKSHKLLGLLLLKSLSFDGKEWGNGTIYDPENGKEYSCKITLNKDSSLNIRGFIGVSLIGRTTVWKKS